MDGTYIYFLAKFKQGQLERAACEQRRAREAGATQRQPSIALKRGFSLRRFFARQS
jgi:hypothetical protein